LPETDTYKKQLEAQERALSKRVGFKGIIEEFARALSHWLLLFYLALLLTAFMFMVILSGLSI
jgi:hypothetical protein